MGHMSSREKQKQPPANENAETDVLTDTARTLVNTEEAEQNSVQPTDGANTATPTPFSSSKRNQTEIDDDMMAEFNRFKYEIYVEHQEIENRIEGILSKLQTGDISIVDIDNKQIMMEERLKSISDKLDEMAYKLQKIENNSLREKLFIAISDLDDFREGIHSMDLFGYLRIKPKDPALIDEFMIYDTEEDTQRKLAVLLWTLKSYRDSSHPVIDEINGVTDNIIDETIGYLESLGIPYEDGDPKYLLFDRAAKRRLCQ
jgi:hypothetical protein